MGNSLRVVSIRFQRNREKRELKDLYRAIARRYIKTREEAGPKLELVHRKPRPNRRRINYRDVPKEKTQVSNLIWEDVTQDERFCVELDPSVPSDRYDKFDPEILLEIAKSLLTKKSKDYDQTCFEAIVAMSRYINAERLARWANINVEDDTLIGDAAADTDWLDL